MVIMIYDHDDHDDNHDERDDDRVDDDDDRGDGDVGIQNIAVMF